MPDDKHTYRLDLDLDFEDIRTDAQRAEDAALGRSVAHAAAELLAEGHAPRAVISAFLSTALGASMRHLGRDVTAALLAGMVEEVERLPTDVGCAGRA